MKYINSARCGQGKSTHLRSLAITSVLLNQPLLIVLKSIDQVETTARLLSADLKKHNKSPSAIIRAIHSEKLHGEDTTVMATVNALLKHQLVIITHHTFEAVQWFDTPGLLSSRDVYFDEASDGMIFEVVYWGNKTKRCDRKEGPFDCSTLFELGPQIDIHHNELIYLEDGADGLHANMQFKALMRNSNYIKFVDREDYETFKQEPNKKRLPIMFRFNPAVFDLPNKVMIFAAAYEHTFMNYVLQQSGQVLKNCGFVKYQNPIRIVSVSVQHKGVTKPFLLSKTSKLHYLNELKEAEKEILLRLGDNEFVHLGNTKGIDKYKWFNVPNAVELKSNCHGSNEYLHIKHFVSSAAFRPTPTFARCLARVLGMTIEQINVAFMIDGLMQAIARTAMRVPGFNDEIVVYLLDGTGAELLKNYYFSNVIEDTIVINYRPDNAPKGRGKGKTLVKKLSKAKTNAEYQKAYRERQKLKKQKGESDV